MVDAAARGLSGLKNFYRRWTPTNLLHVNYLIIYCIHDAGIISMLQIRPKIIRLTDWFIMLVKRFIYFIESF